MSNTRQGLREAVLDDLHAAERWRRGTTDGAGSTTTVVDSAAGYNALYPHRFFGAYVRMTAGAADEEVSRIQQYDPATGTWTVNPPFSAASGSGNTYEIWYDNHPEEADNWINVILSNVPHTQYLPISLADDADMEDSGMTNWTNVGTPGTPIKLAATYFPFTRQVATVITGVGTDEGIKSNPVPVLPGEPLYLNTMIYGSTASDRVATIYDYTNGAAIESVTWGGLSVFHVRLQAVIPTTCFQADVRFLSGPSAGASFQVGPVCLTSGWRNRYRIDSTSVPKGVDVLDVVRVPLGATGAVANTYKAMTEPFEQVPFEVEDAERGSNPRAVVIPDEYVDNLLFMKVRGRYVELSADSDTTVADKDTVVHGVLYHLETARNRPSVAQRHLQTYNRLLELQDYGPRLPVRHANRTSVRMGE